MTHVENSIVTLFSQLKECGIEIFLTQEGWLRYEEELLIAEEIAS